MPIEPNKNSYIALIGAYERDNFGDILFLKVCRKLLEPWPLIPLSLVSRNMQNEGGGTVVSASAWFDCCKDDFLPKAIIVAGGEVLDCPVSYALSCDVDPTRSAAFLEANQAHKKRLGELVSWHAGDFAYVPDLDKMLGSKKFSVPFALNSVGGSSLEPGTDKFSSLQQTLRRANYISVRDAVTHKIITGDNLDRPSVDLNPDIVSTLRQCYAHEVETAFIEVVSLSPWLAEPYLLVQANDDYIRKNSPQRVGEAIALTARSLNLPIVFQPAGIAPLHDDFAMLDQLVRITKEYAGTNHSIHLQRDRNVWRQVSVIANAACFVGTSLHGRIVAAAYGIPRVGLKNKKVNIYATTWEERDLQPFDVPLEELKTAVEKATNTSPGRLLAHADKQAALALEGFAKLKKSLNLFEPPENTKNIHEKISVFTEIALLRECEMLRAAVLDLGYELPQEQEAKRILESQLSNILDSPSWRLMEPIRALRRLFSTPDKSTTRHGTQGHT